MEELPMKKLTVKSSTYDVLLKGAEFLDVVTLKVKDMILSLIALFIISGLFLGFMVFWMNVVYPIVHR